MNTMLRLLWLLFLLPFLLPAATGGASPWAVSSGPSRPVHALGFHGITASVDISGRIDSLLWPHPGGYDQLVPFTAPRPVPSGAQWGVAQSNDIAWLSSSSWKAVKSGPPTPASASLEVISTSPELEMTATQTFITIPELRLVAVRIAVSSPTPIQQLAWFQHFTPVPADRTPPPFPGVVPAAACGFASFFDEGRARLYQFRPSRPGRKDWAHARRLEREGALPAEWSSFPEGVWCATAFSSQAVSCKFHIADKTSPSLGCATGQAAASVLVLPVSTSTPSTYTATAFVSFSGTQSEADRALDAALQRGFDALLSQAEQEYATLLGPATATLAAAPEALSQAKRDLRVLFACHEPESGTLVSGISEVPALAATWPELGAWSALAWQLCGYPDLAKRQLFFFQAPLLTSRESGSPSRMIPELFRTDGAPAVPRFVCNPASMAWIVLGAQQLLRHAPPESAEEQARELHSGLVVPAMDYMRRWSVPTTGGPPPGFDPFLLRDVSSVSNDLQYYLAVKAALEVATSAGQQPPLDWQAWQRELEALLRFRMVNDSNGWRLSPTLAAWAAMTLAPADPLNQAPVHAASGLLPLGESKIPALPFDAAVPPADVFACAVDLVSLLRAPDLQSGTR